MVERPSESWQELFGDSPPQGREEHADELETVAVFSGVPATPARSLSGRVSRARAQLRERLAAMAPHELLSYLQSEAAIDRIPSPKRFAYVIRRATIRHAVSDPRYPPVDMALALEAFELSLRYLQEPQHAHTHFLLPKTRQKQKQTYARAFPATKKRQPDCELFFRVFFR
jgi:hypothetical protein